MNAPALQMVIMALQGVEPIEATRILKSAAVFYGIDLQPEPIRMVPIGEPFPRPDTVVDPVLTEVSLAHRRKSRKYTPRRKSKSADKPFACAWCPREFSKKEGQSRHQKVCSKNPDTGEDPGLAKLRDQVRGASDDLKCEGCGTGFSGKPQLGQHRRYCTKVEAKPKVEKKAKCPHCGEKFKSPHGVKLHQIRSGGVCAPDTTDRSSWE